MAKSPLNEKQSLQTKYRKFKAKTGNKIRKFVSEFEAGFKGDSRPKAPEDYNPPVKELSKTKMK